MKQKCRLIQFVFMLLFIHGSISDCSVDANKKNSQYNVTSWTGDWTFEGFEVGASSGDAYILLSSSNQSQCGIIRENSSGVKVWAKAYTTGQWNGLAVDASEQAVYFTTVGTTTATAMAEVSAGDGSLTRYARTTDSNISFNQTILHAAHLVHQSLSRYVVVGNIQYSSRPTFLELTNDTNILRYYGFGDMGLSNIHSFSFLTDPREWIHIWENDTPSVRLVVSDVLSGSGESFYGRVINCGSTWPSVGSIKSAIGSSNHFTAISYPSQDHVLIVINDLSNLDPVGSLRTAQSSQQLTLGSLYVDSNSAAWLNMYSSSSPYSELTRFDATSTDYTVYQQTGYSYGLQYVFPGSPDRWRGVGLTEHIADTTLAWMGEAAGLSVTTTTTSGLSDTSAYSFSANIGNGLDTYLDNITSELLTTITTSDLMFVADSVPEPVTTPNSTGPTPTTNSTDPNSQPNTESKDDDLSTAEIVGIAVGVFIGLIVIFGVTLTVVYFKCKGGSKTAKHDKVSTFNDSRCQPEQNP